MQRENLEICLGESGILVGSLLYETAGGKEYSCFQYAPSWLESKHAFALAPALTLDTGKKFFRGDRPFPPALMDTMPDSWGQTVHYQNAKATGSKQPLNSLFYLLAVADVYRVGALRIRRSGNNTPFLAQGQKDILHRLYDLDEFCAVVHNIETNTANEEQLRHFIDSACSLGGARPKCSVLNANNRLSIAKFTSHRDTKAVERVEAATLCLAKLCGISAPDVTLVEGPKKLPIAVIERFDRMDGKRIPYISAQTMLDSPTADNRTYTEIADAIRANGAEPKSDLRNLFQRILFTILVSNVDDHLKNHAFLYADNNKWSLSPIFDVNPFPERVKRLKTAIADVGENAASVELLLDSAFYFDLETDEVRRNAAAMAKTIRENWERLCRKFGMTDTEIGEYRPAFEHSESDYAESLERLCYRT